MGDRTYFQFNVHSIPAEQIDAFAEALAATFDHAGHWGTSVFADDSNTATRDRSVAETLREDGGCAEFYEEEVSCGTVTAADLSKIVGAAPGAVWECWEDPKFEWLGEWAGYHPDCGLIEGVECDADGHQVLTAGQVESALIAYAHHAPDGRLEVADLIAAVFPQRRFTAATTAAKAVAVVL